MRKEKARKDRILDIALREFGENGYAAASTNTVAKKAGVSKGLIFYQYGTKKELYLRVVEKCRDDLTEAVASLAPSENADFWESVVKVSQGRTIFFSSHPLHHSILDEAENRPPKELLPELLALPELPDLPPLREKFREIPLRDEALRERAFELVLMTIRHLQNKYARRKPDRASGYSNFAELGAEAREYIELILRGVGV